MSEHAGVCDNSVSNCSQVLDSKTERCWAVDQARLGIASGPAHQLTPPLTNALAINDFRDNDVHRSVPGNQRV